MITKSKFVAGIQCLKRVYLQVHNPELAKRSSQAVEAILKQGQEVGLVAQRAFPGGRTVDCAWNRIKEAVRVTRDLIANPDVPAIFEGTFEHAGVLVRVDVLQRDGKFGYHLVEVKSSTQIKPHYAYDVGIQRHVLTGDGVEPAQVSLMHLNREYIFDGQEYDVSRLFTMAEPKPEDTVSDAEISERLKEQFRILNQPRPPDIRPGAQCEHPVVCEFYDHCNPRVPANHISLLPRIRAHKLQELMASGIISIEQIPDDYPLPEKQKVAVECVKTSKPFFSPELAGELSSLKYPLCFMDFETVFPALPRFAGMRPFDHIPFQWSVHRQDQPDSELKHFEYLAEDDSDPRFPFIESLYKSVSGAGSIVVYYQNFESSRLDDLARWVPTYASEIGQIKGKLWDLLAIVRRNVYHPAFAGSFSLKSVLPALIPEMTYETLEVRDGVQAGLAWARLIAPGISAKEKDRLTQALIEYCKQDTLALVKLLEVLRNTIAVAPSQGSEPESKGKRKR